MSKDRELGRRERAIMTLIQERPLGTQAELVSALKQSGFKVTQATVSREIRRLGLVKVAQATGGYRYAAPGARAKKREPLDLTRFVTGFAEVDAFYILKTLPGRAMAVAVAIDERDIPGINGTLAGDDLVLVLIENQELKPSVCQTLHELF